MQYCSAETKDVSQSTEKTCLNVLPTTITTLVMGWNYYQAVYALDITIG